MKQKKIPLRQCTVTKERLPKQELIRIVRDKEGNVFVDETGKLNGKGAYIKKDIDVLEKAKQNKAIDKALAVKLDNDIYIKLEEVIKK